ncbi:hypothetical protein ILUMI_19432, partial [Ignelater luminosus]
RGIVHVDDKNYYLINPLPTRFLSEESRPHIVIRRPYKPYHIQANHGEKNCAHDAIFNLNTHKNKRKKYYDRDPQNNVTESLPDFKNKTKEFGTKTLKSRLNLGSNKINQIRKKRDAFQLDGPIFVETAVFVDRDLFDHMKSNFPIDTERELIRFVLAMINA